MVKKTVPILNMSCAACASSSQNILKHQEGVISASVNFANGLGTIEYNPESTNLEKLKVALQEAGYDLLIEDNNVEDELAKRHNQKMGILKRKTILAILLSLPVVIIAMVPAFMHMPYANYIMWILSTPVVFYCGSRFFSGAYKQATHKSSNMDTLVALSSGVAYLFSVFNTLYPSYWINKGLEPHVYFEAAAVVITFVLLGKLLEEKAKGATSDSLKKLMGLQPKSVTITKGEEQLEIPVDKINIGDIVLVKPGEKIAVDGVVVKGSSYVDESMISGEPIAVEKAEGGKVFAGTINQKGSFRFEAEKIGKDTLLSHIIQMVQDAQGSKPPVQKLVDKIASVFVPVVILIAIITLIIWIIAGGENNVTQGLLAMITVLVIACPCALGLATPTAIMVGIGKGAENGILIKDAESLETGKHVNVVVLDKTGTITEGKPKVTELKWIMNQDQDLKNILYSMEQSSEHPLGEAISNHLKEDSQFIDIIVNSITGKGITGSYKNNLYFIGSVNYIKGNNIEINFEQQQWIDSRLEDANTVVIFSDSNKLLAIIAIKDEVKASSIEAIKQLQNEGIEVHMLTGDNEKTAASVSTSTVIKHYKAGLLPEEKVNYIKQLQSEKKVVAMVGDGINDSIALAQADLSIAMGKGSDIAMDVAKMTIISNDLTKILQAIKLSKQTVKTIKTNLFWAFIYNLTGIPIAAGILYPVFGFLLNPMLAGAAMALSSVSVVTNSLRLKYINLK